jgi:hypothetical protein
MPRHGSQVQLMDQIAIRGTRRIHPQAGAIAFPQLAAEAGWELVDIPSTQILDPGVRQFNSVLDRTSGQHRRGGAQSNQVNAGAAKDREDFRGMGDQPSVALLKTHREIRIGDPDGTQGKDRPELLARRDGRLRDTSLEDALPML